MSCQQWPFGSHVLTLIISQGKIRKFQKEGTEEIAPRVHPPLSLPAPHMPSIRQIHVSDVYLSRQNVFEIRKALKLN